MSIPQTQKATVMPARPIRLQEQDLHGKVAIVVGASKGIGRSVALNLATRGCAVLGVCSSEKTLPEIDTIASELQTLYQTAPELQAPKVVGVAASITSLDFATAVADALERTIGSSLNILILNAAFMEPTAIGGTSMDLMQQYCLANITNPQLLVGELVKRKMFQEDSRIVLTSSARSKDAVPEMALYTATKAAGEGLIRTWAEAFGGKHEEFAFMKGTTANSVLVGLTKTTGVDKLGDEFYGRMLREQALGQCIPRGAGPSEIADIIGLLCREEGRWITGSLVCGDGGRWNIT